MTGTTENNPATTNAPTGRRDHYIPQGYLRGFIDPARRGLGQPLWHFDIPRATWSERSTREIGYRIGFYDYANPEIGLETADSSFRDLERVYPIVRDKLIKASFANWKDHREFLLHYIQMMRARSLQFFEQIHTDAKSMQAFAIEEVGADGRTMKARPLPPSEIPAHFIKNRAITEMRGQIQGGASWMSEFDWALRYCASPADPFVTCEVPLIAWGTSPSLARALNDKDTLIFFPLCWQACLIGSRQRFDTETDGFGPKDMLTLRRVYRERAKLYLVSPRKIDDL